jgi:hypothetical protein
MNTIDGAAGVIEPKAAILSDRKALGLRSGMLLEFMKNPDCPTTCQHHMPHVVGYMAAYVVPACWRRHRWRRAIPEMSAGRCFEIEDDVGPRTAAPCLQLVGRVAHVGLLSVVGRCPWSGYGAAGWSGRLVWVSRRLSPERRGRRSPAKAPRFCRGTESGTLVNGAEKAHKSGGEPDARDPSCGVISGHIGARCPPTPPYPKGGV